MLNTHQIDELVAFVSSLDRDELIEQFNRYRASFPLDFTKEFLQRQPLDRLRHLFVALCIEQQRLPDMAVSAA